MFLVIIGIVLIVICGGTAVISAKKPLEKAIIIAITAVTLFWITAIVPKSIIEPKLVDSVLVGTYDIIELEDDIYYYENNGTFEFKYKKDKSISTVETKEEKVDIDTEIKEGKVKVYKETFERRDAVVLITKIKSEQNRYEIY